MIRVSGILVLVLFSIAAQCQTAAPVFNFIDYQRSFPRINDALKHKEDTLRRQFREKKLPWPAKNLYLRSFKYDSRLEVWVRNANDQPFKLFKTYKVCALAGTLGPKRMQGDYQVPEGFYYINEFNPRSSFHLSLGLNYPNASDRILGDSLQPGGDIYIHGKCATTGCIPINDPQIEELYILAAHARNEGQDFIPVHIFPVDYSNPKSEAYLAKYLNQFPEYTALSRELRKAYQHFEKTKQLPVVMVGSKGEYLLANTANEPAPEPVQVKTRRPIKVFDESRLARSADQLPLFPGGNQGFQDFIDGVSKEMARYLETGQEKSYLMIEFIIDEKGNPAYAKVLQGGNDELNDRLQEKFENMPAWTPATSLGRPVAIKLKQSLEITR